MCSLSWHKNGETVFIAFNRDELNSRAIATPPEIKHQRDIRFIQPIDPDGGGSWISVNQKGIFLALLNLYQCEVSPDQPDNAQDQAVFVSRGQIITQLASVDSIADVKNYLSQTVLQTFKPFRLVFISRFDQILFSWDGKKSFIEPLPLFVSSSSIETEAVIGYRETEHRKLITSLDFDTFQCEIKGSLANEIEKSLVDFHSNHRNRKDAYSVCMHRSDAKTVSLSLIQINNSHVSFRYFDGPPCRANESNENELAIVC
jgi:transport and Golgi organization protein 2